MAPTRKECPCKINGVECPHRSISPNCHDTCREFKFYVEWNEFYRSLKNKFYDAERAIRDSEGRHKKAIKNDKKFRDFGHNKY